MCGISTVYRYTQLSETDITKLYAMNEEMKYRGPDDEGYWNDNHCGMAQVRLSVIGLQKGKQPLFNEDKSLVLVCNGEIYNYIELKKELLIKGHSFSSDSDSETILHLFEEYGVNCLSHLRGMFAFSIWDINKKRLFVARDRIGEKTMYFTSIPCGFVFSTELKAILKFFVDKPQININQLAESIRYTAPLDKKATYVDQINRIKPGQYILVSESGLSKHTYWKRDTTEKFSGNFSEAKIETLDLIRDSVNICLRSDVPVAVMLSGGIDSSMIAYFAKETGKEINTITVGYKGDHTCDERNEARKFAIANGFIHHEIELDESDFKNCFEEFTRHIDEPITDAAAIMQWALFKKVNKLGFKVLLGGLGGDELFYGYPYWNNLAESYKLHRKHQSLFPWNTTRKKIEYMKFISKNLKYALYAGYPTQVSESSILPWQYDDYISFSKNASMFYDGYEIPFSSARIFKAFGPCDPGNEPDLIYKFAFDNIMTMAYLYLNDRLGMGNSLEVRSPLLDYKLVEFISGLPLEIKYKANQPKFFLKEILIGTIPESILKSPKKGFSPPKSYIDSVISNYEYKMFSANFKFYNSILADRVLDVHLRNLI